MDKSDVILYLKDIEGLLETPKSATLILWKRNVELALEQVQFLIKELENDERREEQSASTDC